MILELFNAVKLGFLFSRATEILDLGLKLLTSMYICDTVPVSVAKAETRT